ncbi:sterol carrier family protein [Mycobacterium sp. NPDC050853]|uniref:sterol carrier family protein n=1 Tax=Mycobacterium sp. NPDC050853 TaxID=3155160 RepID=UPI0033F05D9D
MPARAPDAASTRAAVLAVADWLGNPQAPEPERAVLADAVRFTARTLAAAAPGASVEVRVPPFVAVQCITGPRHTRGTPPNVVETTPRAWLLMATGLLTLDQAIADRSATVSGFRAGEIADWLPLVRVT